MLWSCTPVPAPVRPEPRGLAPSDGPGWRYEVAFDERRELVVEARFPAGSSADIDAGEGAGAFVREVAVQVGDAWRPLAGATAGSWNAPECARGCRVRYRFLLADAARANDDVDVAIEQQGAFEAPPSAWLIRPEPVPGVPYRFHVSTPPGLAFVSGAWPIAGERDTYGSDSTDLWGAPYSGFGRFRVHELAEHGVVVAIAPGTLELGDDGIMAWVAGAARAVAGYYGTFPVPRLLVLVNPTTGGGVGHGKTIGDGGAAIAISVGRGATRARLAEDWILPHEMVHTALPSVPRQHHWLEEGLATYVEPIARVRAGALDEAKMWTDMIEGMPHGLPEEDDAGLDHTPTWGRTYWGGALFCLLADVEIREKSGGEKSLDDALRAIVRAGNIAVRWPLARVLAVGDEATGLSVLRDLHAAMGAAPVPVDLPALWKKLGVTRNGATVVLDDAAPLAAIRRAMARR